MLRRQTWAWGLAAVVGLGLAAPVFASGRDHEGIEQKSAHSDRSDGDHDSDHRDSGTPRLSRQHRLLLEAMCDAVQRKLEAQQAALIAAMARHHEAQLEALARECAASREAVLAGLEDAKVRRALRIIAAGRMPTEALVDRDFGTAIATALIEQNVRFERQLSRYLRDGGRGGDTTAGTSPTEPSPPTALRTAQTTASTDPDPLELLARSTAYAEQALQRYSEDATVSAAKTLARAVAFQKQVLDWLGFTGETIEGNDI